jgi:3-oxoadipate enol-lactonase
MAHVCTCLGRWYYQEYGAARYPSDASIVLLHDLLMDQSVWLPQVARLRDLGRVLLLDGPGHGRSDVPPPFTLEEQARALEEALQGMGARRAILVGQGWGAVVALRLAQQRESPVAGLVLAGASAETETPLRKLRYRLELAFLRHRKAPLWFVRSAVAPTFYGPRARRLRPALITDLHRALLSNPREGMARAVEAVLERDSVSGRLSEVTAPTLVACGRDDPAITPSQAEALARGIHGSRLVWMACGHSPPQERPEDFAMAVVPFVRRILSIRPVQDLERATG